jgi:hypothetical protein
VASAQEISVDLQAFRGDLRAGATACHAEGRGFESLQPLSEKPCICGAFCARSARPASPFEGSFGRVRFQSGDPPSRPGGEHLLNGAAEHALEHPGGGSAHVKHLLVDAHRELGVAVPEQVPRPPRRYPDLRQQRGKGPPQRVQRCAIARSPRRSSSSSSRSRRREQVASATEDDHLPAVLPDAEEHVPHAHRVEYRAVLGCRGGGASQAGCGPRISSGSRPRR